MSSPGGLGFAFHFTQHSAFGYVLGYHYSALRARFSLDLFPTQTQTLVLTQTLTPWAMADTFTARLKPCPFKTDL